MSLANDLSCQELVELVTAYLDGALPEPERACFEEHVALCAGCRNYLESMRITISLVGQVSEDALSPHARAALLDAFRDWKRAGR
jgi:anti-sigma factor RsiW